MNKLFSLALALGFGCASMIGLTGTAFAANPAPQTSQLADHIIAVVNNEPLTYRELQARLTTLPPTPDVPANERLRQAFDLLISERIQLQWAANNGLRIDDAAIDSAEANVARQNQMNVDQLRQQLAGVGLTVAQFRRNLSHELLLQQVRERVVSSGVKIRETDIDAYLHEQAGIVDPRQIALQIAQVFIAVPETAKGMVQNEYEQRARDIAERARQGEDFGNLARTYSDAPEGRTGGQLGTRTADRLPTLFAQAGLSAAKGSIVGPLRSGAGWHVLLIQDKRNLNLPAAYLTETRARHILLRSGPGQPVEALIPQMTQWREQIVQGTASFDNLARRHSQDGSAGSGGSLGWAQPGQFVPEFEEAMNALKPGDVSAPVVSRFGVHLIQVDERRQVLATTEQQRNWVRNLLKERESAQVFDRWLQEQRAQAYVEQRESLR